MTTTNEVRIELSTLCNHTCAFCPHENSFSRKKEIMSNELFNIILKKIYKVKQIDTITLSGLGEMFFDKDIFYKIEKIKSLKYRINILTNGSLLNKEIIDQLLLLQVDSIRLSLHTTDKDEYMEITGSDKYDHVSEMIEYIISHPDKKTEFIITADIVDINKNNVDSLIEKYSNRVDLLEIWKPHNWINWRDYRLGKIMKKTCGRPFKGPVQIQVDGTVNMCCFDYNGELLIGYLKNQSFDEIYSSKEYVYIKECHTNGNMENLLCKNCDQLYESDPSIVIYNSKFKASDRINRTSTVYDKMEKI